jgi:hypothetical protein
LGADVELLVVVPILQSPDSAHEPSFLRKINIELDDAILEIVVPNPSDPTSHIKALLAQVVLDTRFLGVYFPAIRIKRNGLRKSDVTCD